MIYLNNLRLHFFISIHSIEKLSVWFRISFNVASFLTGCQSLVNDWLLMIFLISSLQSSITLITKKKIQFNNLNYFMRLPVIRLIP
jgi:hypothetical protein